MAKVCLEVESFDASVHLWKTFDCGNGVLNKYLKRQAQYDQNIHCAKTYVAIQGHDKRVFGYYTISTIAISLSDAPEDMSPPDFRYQSMPCVLFARWAVDITAQRQGLGRWLLLHACCHVLAASFGAPWMVLVIDAKNETVA